MLLRHFLLLLAGTCPLHIVKVLFESVGHPCNFLEGSAFLGLSFYLDIFEVEIRSLVFFKLALLTYLNRIHVDDSVSDIE
jgi:hypothetical protein